MSDVAFIALTIVVFGVMALVVRGVERLVGQGLGGAEMDTSGGRHGTAYRTEISRADSDDGSGGTTVSVGATGTGAHPDGQELR
jgi:hypothetical protein